MNTFTKALLAAGTIGLSTLSAAPAAALEQEYVPDESTDGTVAGEGWAADILLGLSINLATSKNVVGQPVDGATWTIAVNTSATADYYKRGHEVRNSFSWVEALQKSPLLKEFVKSQDRLAIESIYYYHVPKAPWFGPFGRFQIETSLFKGFDVRNADTTYVNAGNPEETETTRRFLLTKAFRPTMLKESIGAFARPLSKEWLDIDFRLGIGARETLAKNQRALADVADTPAVEYTLLKSYALAGFESALELSGSFSESRVGYHAGGEVLIPFVQDDKTEERSNIELTNLEFSAGVTVKVVEWVSFDYAFRAQHLPQLQKDWGISNNLLLTLQGRVYHKERPVAPPVEETPVEETPADEAPAEEAPADEAPAEEVPAEEVPADEAPADEASQEELPAEVAPDGEAAPADGTAPVDGAAPADGTAPTDGEVPADGGAPAEEAPVAE